MSRPLAAILGGAAGGLVLVLFVLCFLWFYVLHCKSSNGNSETASSDHTIVGCVPLAEPQGARIFTLEELRLATKDFNELNRVGRGSFGVVYKGLLSDGTMVAIKRLVGSLRKEFAEEAQYLSEIRHRNLVTLIGYCQEGGYQMLVFDYVPNGSIKHHLYDARLESTRRLEFKQRLSVALGAAKGMCHLHSLTPPLVHKNFKTDNVLVDENFIAKVADAGVIKLLREGGPSQTSINIFLDPELADHRTLSESSDVYSFGVFLLELIIGREANSLQLSDQNLSLAQLVEVHAGFGNLIDRHLGTSFTSEGMKDLLVLTLRCLDIQGRRRPKMNEIVLELDRILETEMTLTTVMGDGTAIVTLGSQLFSST